MTEYEAAERRQEGYVMPNSPNLADERHPRGQITTRCYNAKCCTDGPSACNGLGCCPAKPNKARHIYTHAMKFLMTTQTSPKKSQGKRKARASFQRVGRWVKGKVTMKANKRAREEEEEEGYSRSFYDLR